MPRRNLRRNQNRPRPQQSPSPLLSEQNESPDLAQQPDPLQSQANDPPAASSPLPQELQEQNSGSSPSADTSHFDEQPEECSGDGGSGDLGPGVGGEVLPRDVFKKSFIGTFNLGGNFLPSLAVAPGETESANAAADALYDSALEVEWLRWLIQPGSVWAARLMCLGAFFIPKAMAARKELQAKKLAPPASSAATAAPAAAPRDPEPAELKLG